MPNAEMNYKQLIKKILPLSLVKKIKRMREKGPQISHNIGLAAGNQPRVFFSYVNDFLSKNDLSRTHGTRDVESAAIVSALVRCGCRVDVARYDCERGIRTDYDYVIGQGIAFRNASALNPKAKRILYLTENPPALSFEKEKERIAYFEERHHIKTDLSRSGRFFKEEDFERLEACIFIGNPSDADKINGIKTYTIRPTGIINPLFNSYMRNFDEAKKRFMWIGSSGAIHKGLDILLDVFSNHPELELYVLGLNESDRRLLSGMMGNNVTNCGYIRIVGEEFAELVSKCGFVVLPSCSERLATSVITGMNHGLIPLVTHETSIEAPVGEVFKTFKVADVEETLVRWSNKETAFLKEESEKTLNFARDTYNIPKYSRRITDIFSELIK